MPLVEISQKQTRELLKFKLDQIKKKNPRYSLRSFARKIGVASGTLSLFINGKRDISLDLAEQISNKLGLNGDEYDSFFRPFRITDAIKNPIEYDHYDLSLFSPEENWIALATLNLLSLKDFILSAGNLSRRLGITESVAKIIIDKLIARGEIAWSKEGKAIRVHSRLQTTDNKKNSTLRQIQLNNLKLAERSLQRDDMQERDFTSMTMAINEDYLQDAKKIIRKFEDEISVFLESGNKNRIYKLNIQLFPLDKKGKE
jgi:transcriptional regulator with XRE-family HTH domain